MTPELLGYELLDSGNFRKLERFGDRLLVRPSKLCLWKPRLPDKEWLKADAILDAKSGWRKGARMPDEWACKVNGIQLLLRLQQNGQVGLFPEHLSYAGVLKNLVKNRPENSARVLNLFAYTGLASLICAAQGASVTHVEIAKAPLTWAKRNVELNSLPQNRIRFIQEDAVSFVDKEIAREKAYDIVIADPPSFSRISDKKSWNLEEVLVPLVAKLLQVLSSSGTLILTSHLFEYGDLTLANLIRDADGERSGLLEHGPLFLAEAHSERRVPAGFFAISTKSTDIN